MALPLVVPLNLVVTVNFGWGSCRSEIPARPPGLGKQLMVCAQVGRSLSHQAAQEGAPSMAESASWLQRQVATPHSWPCTRHLAALKYRMLTKLAQSNWHTRWPACFRACRTAAHHEAT